MSNIEPIRDAQFSFMSFLWKNLTEIREKQVRGEHYPALIQLISLINWLPEDFQSPDKMAYKQKAAKIIEAMGQLKSASVYRYRRQLDLNKALNDYSKNALESFSSDLSISFDRKGYMERKAPNVEHGGE